MITPDFDKTYIPGPRSCTYVIRGNPIPLARPRFSYGNVWDSQKQKKLVVTTTLEDQHDELPLFQGPLHMDVVFFLAMPARQKSSFDKKRHTFHTFKPDLSNLVKWIEDVAIGVLYEDDCIISSLNCQKRYDEHPRTELTITEMRLYEKNSH